MKKILLSVATIVALGTAAQAQEAKFGVKAGVNFANFGGDVEDASSRTGFHVGAVADYMISETFGVGAELVYSQQGSQTESTDTQTFGGVTVTEKNESKQTLNYLNLPIMAKYMVFEGFTIHAGPQIGFLLSAEAKEDYTTTTGDVTESGSATVDNKDGFKSVDFSAVAGVGYELPMGLFFQARYQAGISSVLENSEGLDGKDISTTNNVFSISVGYKF